MNMGEIKSKIKEIIKKQDEYSNEIMNLNKEKYKVLVDNISVNNNNYNKLLNLIDRYKKICDENRQYNNKNTAMDSIYPKLYKKFFYKKIVLSEVYKDTDKLPRSWYNSEIGKPIAFTCNGIGYEYENYKGHKRTKTLDMESQIQYMINKKDIFRNPPIQQKKLEIYQKFFDIIIGYKFINIDFEESININQFDSFTLTADNNDKYEDNITSVTIDKIGLEFKYYPYIRIYSGNKEISSLSFRLDVDESKIKLKYFINQMPEIFFIKLENYIKNIENNLEDNKKIYDKIKDEFGHLLLAGEL